MEVFATMGKRTPTPADTFIAFWALVTKGYGGGVDALLKAKPALERDKSMLRDYLVRKWFCEQWLSTWLIDGFVCGVPAQTNNYSESFFRWLTSVLLRSKKKKR